MTNKKNVSKKVPLSLKGADSLYSQIEYQNEFGSVENCKLTKLALSKLKTFLADNTGENKLIQEYYYIIHDKCLDKDGNLKPAHIHVIILFHERHVGKDIVKKFTLINKKAFALRHFVPVGSLDSAVMYLTHETTAAIESGKHLYDKSEVVSNDVNLYEIRRSNYEKKLEADRQKAEARYSAIRNYPDVYPKEAAELVGTLCLEVLDCKHTIKDYFFKKMDNGDALFPILLRTKYHKSFLDSFKQQFAEHPDFYGIEDLYDDEDFLNSDFISDKTLLDMFKNALLKGIAAGKYTYDDFHNKKTCIDLRYFNPSGLAVSCEKQFLDVFQDVWNSKGTLKTSKPRLNIFIYGPPRTGKGRFATLLAEKYGYSQVFRSSDNAHPFEKYKGQHAAIFDDFRPHMTTTQLCKFFDPFEYTAPPARYSNAFFFTDLNIVTSNSNLPAFVGNFHKDAENNDIALQKRFTIEIKITKEWIICTEFNNDHVVLPKKGNPSKIKNFYSDLPEIDSASTLDSILCDIGEVYPVEAFTTEAINVGPSITDVIEPNTLEVDKKKIPFEQLSFDNKATTAKEGPNHE